MHLERQRSHHQDLAEANNIIQGQRDWHVPRQESLARWTTPVNEDMIVVMVRFPRITTSGQVGMWLAIIRLRHHHAGVVFDGVLP